MQRQFKKEIRIKSEIESKKTREKINKAKLINLQEDLKS